jgi:hypothetical protein
MFKHLRPASYRRRFVAVAVITLFSVGVAPGVSEAAPGAADAVAVYWPGAEKCVSPHQHCYSRAVDVHSNLVAVSTTIQSTWFSMLDQTQAPYQMPVFAYCSGQLCPWFITREMWLGDRSHWIEVGLMNGYESPQMRLPDGSPGCGCQAYFQFWADGPAGDANATTHVIANISPDNTWHTYGISHVSGNIFDVTVDGRTVGVSTTSGASSFGSSAIGSETSGLTTVQPLSYMNESCQAWSVKDASGRWFGVGNPNQGTRGASDNSGTPDQTYFGGWDSSTHQLCIGKGGL